MAPVFKANVNIPNANPQQQPNDIEPAEQQPKCDGNQAAPPCAGAADATGRGCKGGRGPFALRGGSAKVEFQMNVGTIGQVNYNFFCACGKCGGAGTCPGSGSDSSAPKCSGAPCAQLIPSPSSDSGDGKKNGEDAESPQTVVRVQQVQTPEEAPAELA